MEITNEKIPLVRKQASPTTSSFQEKEDEFSQATLQDTTEKVSNQTLAPLKSENDKVKEELEVKDEKPKEKSQEDGKKKKQAPFLQREVKVKNSDKIDERQLLIDLKTKYEKELKKWTNRSKRFKAANFVITLLVVLIQVAQIVIFQLKSVPEPTKNSLATILPSITSAALAIQLKLSWSEKSIKSKRTAGLYNKLCKHVVYRLEILEAGADIDDVVKIWNTGLISEVQEVPAFLLLY